MKNKADAAENTAAKYVIGILLIILLLATSAYAYYVTTIVPDIEEGDIVSDIDPLTGVPTSGTWSFKLDIGNLGTATVTSAANGSFVVLNADGQTIFMNTTSSTPPYTYRSNPRSFELRDNEDNPVTGKAYYEFTAVDSDVIDGIVYHDVYANSLQSYAGQRPFHMELIDAELPDNEWFTLNYGEWDIEYHEPESDCEDGVASFSDLPTDMNISDVSDLDTGEPSGDILAEFGDDDVFFTPGDDVNVYQQDGGSIDAGTPSDVDGNIMLDYEGDTFDTDYEFYGIGEGDIEGTATITGSNGCGYSIGFTATYVGGPTT